MMKVYFVWRGPSPYRVDFFNELGKLCDLTVLFERKPQDISDKDINWFHEDYKNFKGIYLKGKNLLGKIWLCLDIINYISAFKKADIVVVGMYSTPTQSLLIFLFKLFGIRYILNSDGGFVKQESFLTRAVKKLLISGAYAYLSSSHGTSKYLRFYGANSKMQVYPFTSERKSQVIKDLSQEKKLQVKKNLGISDEVMVMFSGQFIYRKGIDVLLRAAKDIPSNCGIYIIGGKATDEYISIVNELSLVNVHFLDFKTPKELEKYYMAADIYVLPTREDIWGLVINEAMSFGLPVITTENCLAGMELIENGINGFLVPINDVNETAKKISILVNNKKMRDAISDANKKKISAYTIENMAETHYLFFESLIKE